MHDTLCGPGKLEVFESQVPLVIATLLASAA